MLFLLVPGLAHAQAEQPPAVPVIKLTVKAAAETVPVLRYELLPNYRERISGNAAVSYYRACLMLSDRRPPDPKAASKQDASIDEMLAKPDKDLKIDELRTYIESYRQVLSEVKNGAMCDRCDWDLERRIDAAGVGVLLPEIQKMRELARLLDIRCRLHIAQGKIAEALHDVQYGLAMARHVGNGSTFIQSLVGMAIFQIFAPRLEQIIEMHACPNLYWSLTALPRPFQDMRKALEGEMRFLEGTLPALRDLEKGPWTIEQTQRTLDRLATDIQTMIDSSESALLQSRLVLAAMVAMQYPSARQSLGSMGKTDAELNAMPAGQVVLLDSLIRYRSLRDEMFVWFNRPYAEAKQGITNANENTKRRRAESAGKPFETMLLLFLPAIDKVHSASVRSERKIAILRTIEALRLHASANHNKFPAKLADISAVPVPIDPVTDAPFEYELTTDGVALLTARTPRGELPSRSNTIKYELTLVR